MIFNINSTRGHTGSLLVLHNVRDSRYRDSRYTLSANSNYLIGTSQQENKYLL